MRIPRLTVVTLGVADLEKATKFYEAVLGTPPNTSYDGVTFIELPGTWISLYPLENLAKDISPEVPVNRSGFSGITLAHNASSKDDVIAIVRRAESAGARVVKEPQDTFWAASADTSPIWTAISGKWLGDRCLSLPRMVN